MVLQRIISLAVDHGWLYATNPVSLLMRARCIHARTCRQEHMKKEKADKHIIYTLKRFKPKFLSSKAYSEIYGINNMNGIIFLPPALRIMHAWFGVWMKFCPRLSLVIGVYETCCVTWFHAISSF